MTALGLFFGVGVLTIGAEGYMSSSAQQDWVDQRGIGLSRRGYGNSLQGPPGRGKLPSKDNPLLDQALDAFKQASHLERSLKRSEEAVSDQTHQLKRELAKAKATAQRTGQVRHGRMDARICGMDARICGIPGCFEILNTQMHGLTLWHVFRGHTFEEKKD